MTAHSSETNGSLDESLKEILYHSPLSNHGMTSAQTAGVDAITLQVNKELAAKKLPTLTNEQVWDMLTDRNKDPNPSYGVALQRVRTRIDDLLSLS